MARHGLVEDELLARYVSEIGQRVAAEAAYQNVSDQFFVLDAPEWPNAMAAPEGLGSVSFG